MLRLISIIISVFISQCYLVPIQHPQGHGHSRFKLENCDGNLFK
jgi:hypothetical protein